MKGGQPGSSTVNTPPGSTAKPGESKGKSPNELAAIEFKYLRDSVYGHQLKHDEFPRALELASRLENQPLSTPDTQYVSSVKKLLTGLSSYDVEIDGIPRDPGPSKAKPDKTKTDFAFLASGQDSHALLAACRYQPVRQGELRSPWLWSLYFLDCAASGADVCQEVAVRFQNLVIEPVRRLLPHRRKRPARRAFSPRYFGFNRIHSMMRMKNHQRM